MNPIPVVLYGDVVRLEPLDDRHANDLLRAAQDEGLWRFMPIPRPATAADMRRLIEDAWRQASAGAELPFAVVAQESDLAVGSTRFLDIDRASRALEIGWTWLAPTVQHTAVNTEGKLLLLRHAFDDLGARRVALKTDARNEPSRRAIERLGAVREGILRQHRICWDGSVRDTVYYSIVGEEWPGVRERLEGFLSK